MDKWFKDILPDKDPYHNRGRDQMRKKGGPEFEYLWDFTPIISTFAQVISQSVSNSGCSDDKMSVEIAKNTPPSFRPVLSLR